MTSHKLTFYSILSAQVLIIAYLLVQFDGVGLEADSITHFLFAKYAPVHPHLYFDHWAKPLFTLLASPFAQFDMIGIKIFNCLNALFTSVLLYKILQKQNVHLPFSASFLYFCFPLFYTVSFTGLTEPLAALVITMAIYLYQSEKLMLSAILISFYPFIRSEGLIFIILFLLVFLIRKQWKPSLALLTGSMVYGFIGLLYYDSPLWVFTSIPYTKSNLLYGHGDWFHFFEKLIYILGVPGLILFAAGFIIQLLKLNRKDFLQTQWLILYAFLSFFMAHVIFWKYGLFNSLGLHRVMGSILPLMALIASSSLHFFHSAIKNKIITHSITFGLAAYLVIFLFTSNPASINWQGEMNLSKNQNFTKEISSRVGAQMKENSRLIYNDNFISLSLNIDHFDENKRLNLYHSNLSKMKSGDFILWDSWHSKYESDVSQEFLDDHPSYTLLFSAVGDDPKKPLEYRVYVMSVE